MIRIIYILSFLCVILNSQVLLAIAGKSNPTNRIILKLKKEIPLGKSLFYYEVFENEKLYNVSDKFHFIKIEKYSLGKKSKQHIFVAHFPICIKLQEVINAYYATGEIEYAEPDFIGSTAGFQSVVPNDQNYYRQWGLKNNGTFSQSTAIAGADIDMENAWNIEQGDSSTIVGIIDSGNKLDHPEFSGRIWLNYDEIPNNGLDDDNNGYIDDIKGWDFANNDNNPTDDYGHGTNVAGIIGANANNTIGFAGVDWNCKLMILKGLDNNNSGFYSWWSSAIYYAVDNGAKVINMSLGGISNSTTLQAAVNYALNNNVVVVVSMMNANSNAPFYPAAFPGVIAVGSTNANDNRTNPFFWSATSGSCYGSHISVVAPGNFIYGLDYQSNTNFNNYWGGTSQAAPHVAGLAALLLAQDSTRTPTQIKSIIESTSEDQVGNPIEDILGWDQYYGYGRINAFNALSLFLKSNDITKQNVSVSLFPNPAHDSFTAVFPSSTRQIQIFNAFGQLLQEKNTAQLTSQKFQLKDNGIYYIQFKMDGSTITKKIIVNH
jgi:thermitase